MIAGELIADFNYVDVPSGLLIGGRSVKVPGAIILADRYE